MYGVVCFVLVLRFVFGLRECFQWSFVVVAAAAVERQTRPDIYDVQSTRRPIRSDNDQEGKGTKETKLDLKSLESPFPPRACLPLSYPIPFHLLRLQIRPTAFL